MAQQFTVNSPEVLDFLTAWHENGRTHFDRLAPNLVYDDYDPKHAEDRKKYIALDHGTSGAFLLDKGTGTVYTIKAYGKPNRSIGHISELTAKYRAATATHVDGGYKGRNLSEAAS